MDNLPEDIQKDWLSIIRRLQSVAISGGLSIIKISILCNENGKPLTWTEPKRTILEPKGRAESLILMVDKD